MALQKTLVTACLSVAMVIGPSIAMAATDSEIADALVEETAEQLGVVVDDPNLSGALAEDLEYAIIEDVIDPVIVDELDESIDAGEDADLDAVIDDNLEEQDESWRDKAPELLTAFETVKLEFQQCRLQTSGPANECARGLGFRLQVASTQMALDELESLRQSLETLSGAELEEAQALLVEQEEELVRKLQRAEAKLDRLDVASAEAGELQAVVTRVRKTGVGSPAAGSAQSASSKGQASTDNGAEATVDESTDLDPNKAADQQPSGENSGSNSQGNGRGNSNNSGQGGGNGSGNSGGNGNSGENKGRGNG